MNQAVENRSSLDILKEAILLERRGRAFYKQVADQSDDSAVKQFFEAMADEERQHVKVLEAQYNALLKNNAFETIDTQATASGAEAHQVLSDAVKQRIAAAGFEAAAISAAMLMEERAIALYSQRAEAATDPSEEVVYRWLAEWEQTHLEYLVALDKDIKETIWNDQNFWPF